MIYEHLPLSTVHVLLDEFDRRGKLEKLMEGYASSESFKGTERKG
jgi:hypothetical protein